jgi:hypothetical protein
MKWTPLICAVLGLAGNPAAAYRIGVFADSVATNCSLQIDYGVVRYMWLIVLPEDAREEPIFGLEFGVRGLPEGWSIDFDQSLQPGVWWTFLFVDNALIGYLEPLSVTLEGFLPLFKIRILAMSQVGPTRIWVDVSDLSTIPNSTGPVVIVRHPPLGECDGGSPHYEAVPATGLSAMINGPCSVSVEDRTWQRVKGLYRD